MSLVARSEEIYSKYIVSDCDFLQDSVVNMLIFLIVFLIVWL